MESFTADFSQFSSTNVRNCHLGDQLSSRNQIQVSQEFF